ncbi:MAG: hypothetical protein U0V87_09620 [Acidobacteriota bacterium]
MARERFPPLIGPSRSAPANRFVRKPALLSFEQAAALPVSGATAPPKLRDAGQLEVGQRVPIIAAAGGIESFAVQIAKAIGAEVTGMCSTSTLELVSTLVIGSSERGAGRNA